MDKEVDKVLKENGFSREERRKYFKTLKEEAKLRR